MPERGSRRREEDIGESWPELPEWATADVLDLEVRRDLRGLSKEGADWVAAHLVAASALADDDPETAWHHARAARARGGRIGVVRETVGLVAYRAGEWAEAIGELRAARRMGGGPGHLAVLADCERALGHPERAIELSRSAEADELDPDAAVELSIVVSGARADLGQFDAALAHLERVGLDKAEEHPRLAYAYADLLLQAGRPQEALSWFIRSANADTDEETDALDRVAALSDAESGLTEASGEAATTDSAAGETAERETVVGAKPSVTAQSVEAAGQDESSAASVDDVESEFDDGEVTAGQPGHGAVESADNSAGDADLDETDPDDADLDDADLDDTDLDDTDLDNTDPDDTGADGDRPADDLDSTGDTVSGDERFAADDFEDDDDLEFKPASASASIAGSAGTSIVDHNEVPSLLFSDDPQTGDR